MNIKKLVLGNISVNCYLVLSEDFAIVIDPGYYCENIVEFLNENKDKSRLILLTHGHFDHIGGAKQISGETGVKIGIGENDAPYLKSPTFNLSGNFGIPIKPFEADFKYKDGEKIIIGNETIKVIETPGHTKGSVCYLLGDNLFCGDTLFFEGYGRTDFPGGDMEEMKKSFYKITTLFDKETVLFPGHGESTTIAHEIENNPLGYFSAI